MGGLPDWLGGLPTCLPGHTALPHNFPKPHPCLPACLPCRRYALPAQYDATRRSLTRLWGAQQPVVEAARAELADRLERWVGVARALARLVWRWLCIGRLPLPTTPRARMALAALCAPALATNPLPYPASPTLQRPLPHSAGGRRAGGGMPQIALQVSWQLLVGCWAVEAVAGWRCPAPALSLHSS